MAPITPVSKNDVMEENEKKSGIDGLSLRKWGFRNHVSAGNEGKGGGSCGCLAFKQFYFASHSNNRWKIKPKIGTRGEESKSGDEPLDVLQQGQRRKWTMSTFHPIFLLDRF
ncbi:hypothetical protein TNCV_706451 [Trichonephila clavipes]|nr:hypothetical protein TNCV_706451 [Trichonephila clavipes]